MKKYIALFLVLVLLLGCLFSLTSCSARGKGSKPELDLEKALLALQTNKYSVSLVTDATKLDMGVTQLLKAYYKTDSITVTVYENKSTARLMYDQYVLTSKQKIESYEADIKVLEHMLSVYPDRYNAAELKNLRDTLTTKNEELAKQRAYSYGMSGNIIWHGTEGAILATRTK